MLAIIKNSNLSFFDSVTLFIRHNAIFKNEYKLNFDIYSKGKIHNCLKNSKPK